MKNLIIILTICISWNYYSQEVWQDLPLNPNCQSVVYDIEMVDGKVYQFYNQFDGVASYNTYAYAYNNNLGVWEFQFWLSTGLFTKIKTEKIGSTVYIVGHDGVNFKFYSTTQLGTIFPTTCAPNFPMSSVNDNWEFHAGKNANELYVLFTTGTSNSDVHGLEYISGSNTWASVIESSTQNLSSADLQIQSKNTEVYFGVFSNVMRCTRFVKGSINPMFAYDGLTGNINSDGVNWQNPGFALIGNKNDYVGFYGTEDANNQSYEAEIIAGSNINIITTSPNVVNNNVNSDNLAKESSASHAFIYSTFRNDGVATGGTNENLKVIRRDISASGNWQTVANANLLPQGTFIETNSLELSLDNNNKHIVAAYVLQGSTDPEMKVSNNTPDVLVGSNTPNTGLCANQVNELYSNVEIQDVDFDQITITNIISLNLYTSNLIAIPNGIVNGVYKFKILGIPTGASDQIQLVYTDGFGSFTLTLDVYNSITNPIPVQFTSDPVIFCENESLIDLSQYVSYYDQGSFRLNGLDLENSLISATFLSNNALSNGTLRYVVNINGCFITTSANYSIVAPPTINVVSSPSSCALNNGSATATVIAGASASTNFYWTTGETTATISNLIPGAYYAFVNDANNCKATALASVEASEITFVETVTNPTCFGASDGSITVAVTGSTNYLFIWTNGQNGTDILNIPAGNYEFTLYDVSGCEIKKSYTLGSPSEIQNSIITNKPDCGATNGGILTNVSGGSGSYSYLWNTSAVSPNLTSIAQGYYELTTTDGNGCTRKDSLYLNDNDGIMISDSLILPNCDEINGGINLTLTLLPQAGTVNSIIWSNGLETEDIYNLAAGTYSVSINSGVDCISQKTIILGNKQPLRSDICVVTVDTATTTNLVVWEKTGETGISYYNIYRENDDAGNYLLIDTVQYSNLSVFNDVIASPLQRSWRYRISAVNTCGVESPLSNTHKTLHLNTIAQVTAGVFDIYWDDYEGISSGNYIVSRFTDQAGWVELSPAVPFGSPTMFTDTPPTGFTNLDYYVDFELAFPCTATFRSQDFDRSRSNKERGVFNPGEGTGNSNNEIITLNDGLISLSVSPNPFQDELIFNLTGESKAEIQLFDLNGKNILNLNCTEGINNLSTKNLNSGVYFVKAKINNTIQTIKVVK